MTDYTEILITHLKEANLQDRLDVFIIYHILNILGPHECLIESFCTNVLRPHLSDVESPIQWQDVYGALKTVQGSDNNPFDVKVDSLLYELTTHSGNNYPKKLFLILVDKARRSGNPIFDESTLRNLNWDINIIRDVCNPLIEKRLLHKNGQAFQLLVQAHYLVSNNWLKEQKNHFRGERTFLISW